MSDEEWRPVVGWEGCYEVSSEGTVRSLSRPVRGARGSIVMHKGRILRSSLKRGYPQVALQRDGQIRYAGIHRLVLEAFVGPSPSGYHGCHTDGIKTNNTVSNLRWDTPSANALDIVRHGHNPFANKTHCPQGHEYNEENTVLRLDKRGRRCRQCAKQERLRRTERDRLAKEQNS